MTVTYTFITQVLATTSSGFSMALSPLGRLGSRAEV
jgi:hypothetical protein